MPKFTIMSFTHGGLIPGWSVSNCFLACDATVGFAVAISREISKIASALA